MTQTFAAPLRAPADRGPPRMRFRVAAGPARVIHALLLATALVVFAWPIALPAGLFFGALGAAGGSVLAELLVARRYRLYAVALLALASPLAGMFATWVVTASPLVAGVLSPVVALETAEASRWASVALGSALLLRATALRYRAALALEGGVVVLAIATTVAAHRDGMIARPLQVSDWFWSQGIDPVLAFLGIGLFGGVVLAGVLVYGRSSKRTAVQLALVLLLGFVLALRLHGADADRPRKNPSGSQLDSNKDQRTGAKNGGGGSGGKNDSTSPPKDDPMPSGGEGTQNRPAAIVIFHKDVQPGGGVFYFRHAAFSQYNGVRLVETSRTDVDQDAVRAFSLARQEVPGTLRDAAFRTTVATDVALLTDHNRLFALTDAAEIAPMPNPEPARFRRAYHVVSSVVTESYQNLLGATAGDPAWSDDVWSYYTEVPRDPRYRKLASELKASLRAEYAADPMAQAMIVKKYLEENATYSFARNYEGSEDPTAAFLFSEDKRGYCVHLAHAATFLLRALGVPARVSAGYAVPAANLGGGSALLIKSGDAHAWAEIYLEEIGWVPIEVTPEKTDVKPQPFSEKDLQQLFGEMARKEGRTTRDAYSGPTIMDAIRAALQVVPKILLAAVALAYLTKLWRLTAPLFARRRQQPRVAYRAALDRLSAVGLMRSRGEPRERFARRVEAKAPTFRPLTELHVGAAFGSRLVGARLEAAEPRLGALAWKVGGEVRRAVPWWLYALGLINPVSWFWSR